MNKVSRKKVTTSHNGAHFIGYLLGRFGEMSASVFYYRLRLKATINCGFHKKKNDSERSFVMDKNVSFLLALILFSTTCRERKLVTIRCFLYIFPKPKRL